MKGKKNGEHGSVTVVLALMLVPVLLVTAVFVDGARFTSADSVIRSNQELAINSVLAENNDDLHRMFGLLATVSDAGLLDEANAVMLQSVAGDPEAGNLLRIDVDSSQIQPVSGSSLTEATIIANQITEYMKYRAPLNMVSEILDSLDWLKNLKEKIDLMKKRVEYFKKINDLLDLISEINSLVETLETQISAINDNVQQLVLDSPLTVLLDAIDLAMQDEDPTTQQLNEIDQRLSATTSAITDGQSNVNAAVDTLTTLFGDDGESGKVGDLVEKTRDLFEAKEEYTAAVNDSSSTEEEKQAMVEEADSSTSVLEEIEQALKDSATELVNEFTDDVKTAFTDFQDELIVGVKEHLGSQYHQITLNDIDYHLIEAVVEDLTGEAEGAPQTPSAVLNKMFPNGLDLNMGNILTGAIDNMKGSLAKAVDDVAGKLDIWETIKTILFEQLPASVQGFHTMVSEFAGNTAWDESRIGDGIPGDVIDQIVPDADSFSDEDSLMDSVSDGGDGGILGAMGDLVDGLGSALTTAYDNILLSSYISGHFTHAAMDREGTPTRINNSEFASCYTGPCRAELEYILTGENGSKTAFGMVFGLRVVTNLMAALTDKRVQAVRTAVMAIPVVGQALALVITPALAVIQSAIDMQTLIVDQGEVPLYTNQLSVLSGEIGGLKDVIDDLSPGSMNVPTQEKSVLPLSYTDYMNIFLFIAMLTGKDAVMERAGTIIEYNVRYNDGGFRLTNAYTAYFSVTEYSVQPLFTSMIASSNTENTLPMDTFRFTGKQTYALGF